MKVEKNNKRILHSWAFYDWANSVFPLIITAAIFPSFYETVTTNSNGSDIVEFLGINIKNTVLYSYSFSFSFLTVAILSPFLSGIADITGKKKSFMKFFVFLGAISCSSLFFFDGNNIEFGIIAFIMANIGFNGSLVFYNAYLPEIATLDKMDKISAKGYSLGYAGSVILLIANLIFILNAKNMGISNNLLPYKISFLSVGLWWILFSQYTFKNLPQSLSNGRNKTKLLTKGFKELLLVWKEIKKSATKKKFLFAFFFYSMGVQTVIYMATIFGAKELHISTIKLIISILIIQIVGIGGAYLFSWISKRKNNIFALTVSLVIWIFICVVAYFIYTDYGFYFLAFMVGLVMGGIQSISRSTYSKLIPQDTKDVSSYFSFYEFTEKIAIVIGIWSYGYIEFISGSMRNSVFTLGIFFLIGILILKLIKKSPQKGDFSNGFSKQIDN